MTMEMEYYRAFTLEQSDMSVCLCVCFVFYCCVDKEITIVVVRAVNTIKFVYTKNYVSVRRRISNKRNEYGTLHYFCFIHFIQIRYIH